MEHSAMAHFRSVKHRRNYVDSEGWKMKGGNPVYGGRFRFGVRGPETYDGRAPHKVGPPPSPMDE